MNTNRSGQRFLFRPHERLHTRREFTRAMTEGQRFFALGIRFFYVRSALPWRHLVNSPPEPSCFNTDEPTWVMMRIFNTT